MKQCIPNLLALLAPLAPAFREEVFATFCLMTGAWIVCLGRRTVSRVWETTGEAHKRNHAAAFRLFSEAAWNWDEVGRLLMVEILASLVPGTKVWLVVDDTLCHKRGAKVAFGGIFLDAVLSSKKHKVFRYGNNWVMMGIVVRAKSPNSASIIAAGLILTTVQPLRFSGVFRIERDGVDRHGQRLGFFFVGMGSPWI